MYKFLTSCVDAESVDAINEMVDANFSVEYSEFLMNIDKNHFLMWCEENGYSFGDEGLKIYEDFAVSFHTSTYLGKDCYYFVWSHIEFIYIKEGYYYGQKEKS